MEERHDNYHLNTSRYHFLYVGLQLQTYPRFQMRKDLTQDKHELADKLLHIAVPSL